MSSKYFGNGSRVSDFNNNFTNIDTLLDAVSKMQEVDGRPITFIEDGALQQSKSDTKESDEKHSCSGGCNTCDKCNCESDTNKKKKPGGTFLHEFGLSEDDEEDDEPYVCEYCDALGYNRKYKPDLCDACTQCESCTEYLEGECAGCEFSVIRDGIYYRDKLPESELMESDERDILNTLQYGKIGGEPFKRVGFSVLKL